MRVLVAGIGSIGSLFAGYLSKVSEITAVDKESWHVSKIRERGYLVVKSPEGDERKFFLKEVYDGWSYVRGRSFDLILITVKASDTEKVLTDIKEHGIDARCYVLLQNGYGNEDVAKKVLGDANIVRALTNNGAHIESPGTVVHAGRGETFAGGVYGEEKEDCARSFVDLVKKSGLPASYTEKIQEIVFRKLIVNAAINPLTAILRVKNRAVAEDRYLRSIVEDVVREVVEVARVVGIDIDYSSALNNVLNVAKATGENVSSMLQDVLRGRRTEIDFINGAVVRVAEAHNLKTPVNKTLYYLIKFVEQGRKWSIK